MGAAPQLAEELFNEHHRRIYLYCLRQLGSREEAEDAVQATYLNACRSLMDGFEPEAAQAWLFKVAYEIIATPLTYAIVGYLKRVDHSDVYDAGTDFNPLSLR